MEQRLRVLMIAAQPGEAQRIEQLLVEGEETGRLPALQVKFETAANADAAGDELARGLLDAVFLNLAVPEDLHALTELFHAYPDLPIIIGVVAVEEPLALLALTHGAADYWLKDTCGVREMAAIFRHVLVGAQLKASRQRLRWLETGMSEVVWRARPDLHWDEVTASIERLTGYTAEEALGMTLNDFIAPTSRPLLLAALQTTPLFQPVETASLEVSLELEHIHKDGHHFWAEHLLNAETNPGGQVIGLQGLIHDVTDRHAIQERLNFISLHDPLTGLFNRNYLEEEMNRLEFSRLYPITFLMVDFVGLQGINTDHGMAAGEEMLKRVGNLLRAAFRSEDMIARVGENDFVVIMPHAHPRAGSRALQRVLNLVDAYNQDGPEVPLNLTMEVITAEPGQSLVQAFKTIYAQKSVKKVTS